MILEINTNIIYINVLDYKKAVEYIIIFVLYSKKTIKEYNFEDKIITLNKIIQDKTIILDKDALKSFSNKIKEISDTIEEIKKMNDGYGDTWLYLDKLIDQYNFNKDLPEALNIYEKMSKDILNKEIEKFIKYEKIYFYIK